MNDMIHMANSRNFYGSNLYTWIVVIRIYKTFLEENEENEEKGAPNDSRCFDGTGIRMEKGHKSE